MTTKRVRIISHKGFMISIYCSWMKAKWLEWKLKFYMKQGMHGVQLTEIFLNERG